MVADVRLYREGIADLLDRKPDFQVVATVAGAGSVDAARACQADVAVVHLTSPAGHGAVREMLVAAPEMRIVALSIADDPDAVVPWAEAGISAYVPPEGTTADLEAAIRGAATGVLSCSGRVAAGLLRRVAALAASTAEPGPRARLTRREREIVALIDEGLANKEIASRLQIELPTVKNHVHHILEKLGARGRSEAAWRLRQHDLGHPVPGPR